MHQHSSVLTEARRKRANASGFTLVELLVVIVILGILAAVVVFAVSGITDRGETSACKAELRSVRTAVQSYYAQSDPPAYPTSVGALTPQFLDDTPVGTYTIASNGQVTQTACDP